MSPIGSTSPLGFTRPLAAPDADALQRVGPGKVTLPDGVGTAGVAPAKFDSVLTRAIDAVENQQSAAAATTRSVLLGDNGRLHESMIAMQEASLSLSLMIEVRNKVVEGYQELMRMPV